MAEVISVSALNQYVKTLLDANDILFDLALRGEIANFVQNSRSGHCYFSLRDEASSVKAVMFRSDARRLGFRPEEGMKVIVRCRATLYERDGAFQVYVNDMFPDGIGSAQLAFEQLKAKLEQEGLFAPEHKKPLPAYPKCIGIVTSKTGAALQDIRNIISRRWPAVRLLLCPVRCKTPLISAIGHEIDFTILDFVADQRAPTPSAAAELAVPDRAELARKLYNLEQNIQNIMQNQLKICYNELMQAEQTLSPEAVRTPLTARRQSLAARQEQLQQAMQQKLRNKKEQLGHAAALAGSLSPYQVLARGYAMLYDKNKKLCTADSLRAGDTVTVRGAAKLAHCTVISVEEQDESTQNL